MLISNFQTLMPFAILIFFFGTFDGHFFVLYGLKIRKNQLLWNENNV